MKTRPLFANSMFLVMMLQSQTASAQVIETQTFENVLTASAAGWTAFRNTIDGNSFGFTATNFTGGLSPAGEAGGTFARTTNLAYYADLSINGSPNLSFFLQASGELTVANFAFNNGIRVGFFDANDTTGSIDFPVFK